MARDTEQAFRHQHSALHAVAETLEDHGYDSDEIFRSFLSYTMTIAERSHMDPRHVTQMLAMAGGTYSERHRDRKNSIC